MFSPDLNALIADYKSRQTTASFKELADMEHLIWSLVPMDLRRTTDRGSWLQSTFGGGSPRDYIERFQLYAVGAAVEPLWPLIHRDGGMSVTTAVRLLRLAKSRQARSNGVIDLKTAIEEEIKAYQALPYTALDPRTGHTINRRSPARLPRSGEVVKHKRKRGRPALDPTQRAKDFFSRIRVEFSNYIAPHVPDLDELQRDQLWKEIEIGLNSLIDQISMKVRRIQVASRSNKTLSESSSRRKLLNAFKVLHLDAPPKDPSEIDLVRVRRQYHRLATQYHPDSHGGDDTTRHLYQAVVEAFDTVETFVNSAIASKKSSAASRKPKGNRQKV